MGSEKGESLRLNSIRQEPGSTEQDTLTYISAMLKELHDLADKSRQPFLTYLIDLAYMEAQKLTDISPPQNEAPSVEGEDQQEREEKGRA